MNDLEQRKLLSSYRETGNQKNFDKLVLSFDKMVYSIIYKLNKNKIFSSDDLYSEGMTCVINSLNKFDLSKKNHISTYVYSCVKGALLNYINKNSSLKTKDKSKSQNSKSEKENINYDINSALNVLSDKEKNIYLSYVVLNKTLKEIGDEYGLSKERIRQIKNIASNKLKKELTKI